MISMSNMFPEDEIGVDLDSLLNKSVDEIGPTLEQILMKALGLEEREEDE